MNTCGTYREQIDLRLDGMLDAVLDARLSAHLAQCAGCRRYIAAQQTLSGDLATLSRAADVLAAPRTIQTHKMPDRLHAGRVAAAIALAVLCTWTFVRRAPIHPNIRSASVAVQQAEDAPVLSTPIQFAASVEPLDGATRFAIPLETDNPRVHMVWLYDTVASESDPKSNSTPSS